jgi:hypothetical protein
VIGRSNLAKALLEIAAGERPFTAARLVGVQWRAQQKSESQTESEGRGKANGARELGGMPQWTSVSVNDTTALRTAVKKLWLPGEREQ